MSSSGDEPAAHVPKRCQVVGCQVDVAALGRAYCLKRRLCEEHLKADSVVRRGHGDMLWRFCFQCGKLEPLTQFDGLKRTCRAQLERRKASDPKRRATWAGGEFKRRLKRATGQPATSRTVARSDSIGDERGASRDDSEDKDGEVSCGQPLAWHASCGALQLEKALLESCPAPAASAQTPPPAPCACTVAAAAPAAAAPAASFPSPGVAPCAAGGAAVPPLPGALMPPWGSEGVPQQQLMLPAVSHMAVSRHYGGLVPDNLEQILEEELVAAVAERAAVAPPHQQHQQPHPPQHQHQHPQHLQLASTAQPSNGGSALTALAAGWTGAAHSQALPVVPAAPPAAAPGFFFAGQQMGFMATHQHQQQQQQQAAVPVQHVHLQQPAAVRAAPARSASVGVTGDSQDARMAKLLHLQHQYTEAKALLDQAEALVGSLVQQQHRILAAAPQGP